MNKSIDNLLNTIETTARTETRRKNPSANHENLKCGFPFRICSRMRYYERGHDYRVADRRRDGCCENFGSHRDRARIRELQILQELHSLIKVVLRARDSRF